MEDIAHSSESSIPITKQSTSNLPTKQSSIKESIVMDGASSKFDNGGSAAKNSSGVDSVKESIRVGSNYDRSFYEPTIPESIASANGSTDEQPEEEEKNEKATKSRFSKQQEQDQIEESIISQAPGSSSSGL
eukprot:CAMPEP_0170513276 /NCGR_PEP_ID=MMETSP0208-20121228/67312_1 /TAXON_ID=197538 /ORGANISM="Strombidium inclinatum, Strain S3" /LENGTH=131 /DNA_ID=CAMNT_0010796995 /DNA_START=2857 /DNA_END=3248 /DNA_ORIENTATION=+